MMSDSYATEKNEDLSRSWLGIKQLDGTGSCVTWK